MSQTKRRSIISLLILIVLIPLTLYLGFRFFGNLYYLTGLLIIVYMMLPFFLAFEHRRPKARELATLAVLCALAVASRAAFSWFPSFKPMMAIIMITGIAFGPESGFLCGAITALVSNFLFGQGAWTPWQMFAYGLGGFIAGGLHRLGLLPKKRLLLSIFGALLILLIVGPLLDTCTALTMTYMAGGQTGIAVYLAGIPLNLIHAAATFLTLFFFSDPLLRMIRRIQTKYGMLC